MNIWPKVVGIGLAATAAAAGGAYLSPKARRRRSHQHRPPVEGPLTHLEDEESVLHEGRH
jgi:hypothetical protein